MSARWDTSSYPKLPRLGVAGLVRVLLRGAAMIVLVFGGLVFLLAVRLFERPFYGLHRPFTPAITRFVCRNAFRLLGMEFAVVGVPMEARGAVVANHSSWLDIFALNAAKRIYFVSKSEVASWPAIGWLARATGTVFIERNPARAREQTALFQDRLLAGHKLLFFPEGTSTDGMQVLPFKTTLFQAFFAPELRDKIYVQPVTVVYRAPEGEDARFYGWWGGMELGPHLLATLALGKPGGVEVVYGTPMAVADFQNRKALAAACEEAVRRAHTKALSSS
ncbi:1-acyl-sn-glycerol-3-phosphate acyltransferase [Sulfitobacter sp. S223]|uniref:lysophospholipid acyltransferase family protein n=1 Tax=Sulfitobacter sp. S223 TaxID=2867023 RepID=UPI0021A293E4|nr:lysophospholipid acyltransferase family protein [Sulfitobacter sp. S223]UWR28071.1 1-acyl-sn-glycerol-3-phosphate acyltransferase [Sulfitobacter sp. S223]